MALRELLIEIGIDIDLDPVVKLNEELDDMMKKFKKLDASKIENLDKDFKELEKTTKQINKNLDNMKKGFREVGKEAEKVSDSARDISRGVDRAEQSVESLRQSLNAVSNETNDLRDGFRSADGQAQRLGDTLESAERQVSSLVSETARLDGAFRGVTQEASRLNSELNSISFNGLQSEISRLEGAFGGIVQAAQRAGQEAGQIGDRAAGGISGVGRLEAAFGRVNAAIDKASSGAGQIGAAGALGVGVGAAGLVDQSLQNATLETKIAISTENLEPKEQKQLKKAVKQAMAMGVDEDAALEGARRQYALNPDAGTKENNDILKKTATISSAFPMVDYTELTQEVNEIGREINLSSNEAAAMTNTLLKTGFPPEQIDIISEYGKQMKLAGYTAEEIQGIMSAGVATGTWNIDNLLDGVKEGRLQMASFGSGLSDSQSAVLKTAGLSSDQFQSWGEAVAAGGARGSQAMQEVTQYIANMQDGAAKNDLATLVFGTKWEDQGSALTDAILNAEKHIVSLTDAQKGLKSSVDLLEDDPVVKLKQAFDDINEALEPVYEKVADVVAKFAEWISENPKLTIGIAAAALSLGGILAGVVALGTAVGSLVLSLGALRGFGSGLAGLFGRGGGTGGAGGFFRNFGRSVMDTFGAPQGVPNGTVRPNTPHPLLERARRQQQLPQSEWANLERESREAMRNYSTELNRNAGEAVNRGNGGSSSLNQAARQLVEAANIMKRTLSNIKCICDCNGGGDGNNRNSRSRRGNRSGGSTRTSRSGGNPVDDLNTRTGRSTSRASGVGSKLGKIGKVGGIATVALGGVALASQLKAGDGKGASETGGAIAGGLAGAKIGAIAGTFAGPIGTAVGGVAGGVIGSIAGSKLGGKVYEGVKSFNWGGLKEKASSATSAVGNAWNGLKEKTAVAFSGMGASSASAAAATGISASAMGMSSVRAADITGSSTSRISSMYTNLGSTTTAATGTMNTAVGGAGTMVAGTAVSMAGSWAHLDSETKAKFSGMKGSIIGNMNQANTGAVEDTGRMAGSLKTNWSSLEGSAKTTWSGVASAITTSISGAVSKATTWLTGLGQKISSLNLKELASAGVGKVKSFAGKAWSFITGSHATGLGRVPYNGYIAELHKDEAVLTANQANLLRSTGMLRGDGAAPTLSMQSQAGSYSPLSASPSSVATTAGTTNNTVRATVNITVDGSGSPQQTAVSIKDELEGWFSSLGDVFPAAMEG